MARTKAKVHTMLPIELVERARDAAAALGRPLNEILTDALQREVTRLERGHGGAFPVRENPLRRGRRKSTGKRAG